jgi:hypothetical protein
VKNICGHTSHGLLYYWSSGILLPYVCRGVMIISWVCILMYSEHIPKKTLWRGDPLCVFLSSTFFWLSRYSRCSLVFIYLVLASQRNECRSLTYHLVLRRVAAYVIAFFKPFPFILEILLAVTAQDFAF